ncbi:MAG: hypothetical protein HYS09_09435 [Chloroflexi bacterium]|nr:hypothetical protein [Chloroflexota bacterium]
MTERGRPGEPDIKGPVHGDWTDAGALDEEEDLPEDDEEYEVGPDDPDYDLSEGAGYAGWEPRTKRFPWPQWLIVALAFLLILALVVPSLLRLP